MTELFNTILFEPVFNLLIWLYNVLPGNDIGLAIVILTVIIKIILLPFAVQAIKSQKAMQDLQPKLTKLKKQYKDDKEALARETMNLYKEQKVNPLSSCLPILIQLPFLIAVYQAFRHGLASTHMDQLYSFVANPGHVNTVSYNLIDLAAPSALLAVLAGLAQYLQAKLLPKAKPKVENPGANDEKMLANVNTSMMYFMPVMTVLIGMQLPAGLTLYWFITTLLTALQQLFMFRKKKNSDSNNPEIIPPKDKADKWQKENSPANPAKKTEDKTLDDQKLLK